MGLAYAPVGGGWPAESLGDLREGVGWSTMKVPVAIAVVKAANAHPSSQTSKRSASGRSEVSRLLRLAITASDNDAAMALWSRLGSPTAAAAQTEAVLRECGDTTTVVPPARLRPEFSPFGQSSWSLTAQATFAACLPGLADAGPVLELMGQVTPSQRWGIGALSTTVAFKGGWGPGTDGAYLVRQMAVLHFSDGADVGLALAARPADGRFETGVTNLDALAGWVAENIHPGLPGR